MLRYLSLCCEMFGKDFMEEVDAEFCLKLGYSEDMERL